MKVYTLKAEGFQRERSKAIKRALLLNLLMLAFAAALLGFLSASKQGAFADRKVPLWPILVMVAALFTYSTIRVIRRSLKILREGWDSYELRLGPDFIVKKQVNMPDVEISRDEATKIHEAPPEGTPNGLVIRTADRQRFINVPVALEGYDDVRQQLGQWLQLEPLSTRKYVVSQTLLWLLVPAGYIVIFVSQNVWLVLTAGVALIALMCVGVVELRRSMNVDSRVKNLKLMIVAIIVLTAVVTIRVYAVVAHLQK